MRTARSSDVAIEVSNPQDLALRIDYIAVQHLPGLADLANLYAEP